jgi:hypothetical protein
MKKLLSLLALTIGSAAASVAQAEPSVAPAAVPGFKMGVETADVPLGNNVTRRMDLGLDKWIGDQGVFATNPVTGSERFIPNSTSPILRKGPLTSNAEEHNRTAVEYFTARGLPSDQIGFVQVLTHMSAEGQTGTAMDSRRGSFQGYTTVIARAIDGVGVPDSFAAIRFNQDGVPTMIWKYWPDIPRSVVDQANALRTAVADPSGAVDVLQRLPADVRSSAYEVTIRHSDFDYDTARANFQAFASLDVHQERGAGVLRPRTRHFDVNGQELTHPNHRAALSAATPDSVKSR